MTDLDARIAFRCTSEDKEQIRDQANDAGMNISEYLLWLVMMDGPTIGDDMKGGE